MKPYLKEFKISIGKVKQEMIEIKRQTLEEENKKKKLPKLQL